MTKQLGPTPTLGGKLLFPSLYLNAAEMGGRDTTLTISRVVIEELKTDRGSEPRPILYFRELDARASNGEARRLVLNKTNSKTIARIYGGAAEKWVGKRITLYPTTCEAFGETVECVRVRAKTASTKTSAATSTDAAIEAKADEWESGRG